jgi:hypothetical protein
MRADIHDGQEQRSNQRPDTLMQDAHHSLATHGRITLGQKRHFGRAGRRPLCPRKRPFAALARNHAMFSRSGHHAVRLGQHYVALREDERPLVRDLIRGLTILTDLCQKGSCVR